MSFYTSISLHPVDKTFVPTLEQLTAIVSYMEVERVDSVSVSPRVPLLETLRRRLFPRIIESYPEVPELVQERDVTRARALELYAYPGSHRFHFMPKHEGWCKRLTTSIQDGIPTSISDSFRPPAYIPWDTGISLGPWATHDFNSGKVMASGRFAISRSGNSYPRDIAVYLAAFKDLEPVTQWKAFLELSCGTPWTFTMTIG